MVFFRSQSQIFINVEEKLDHECVALGGNLDRACSVPYAWPFSPAARGPSFHERVQFSPSRRNLSTMGAKFELRESEEGKERGEGREK